VFGLSHLSPVLLEWQLVSCPLERGKGIRAGLQLAFAPVLAAPGVPRLVERKKVKVAPAQLHWSSLVVEQH
jgi:hypothetical protein